MIDKKRVDLFIIVLCVVLAGVLACCYASGDCECCSPKCGFDSPNEPSCVPPCYDVNFIEVKRCGGTGCL